MRTGPILAITGPIKPVLEKMKTNLIIPLLLVGGVAVFIYTARSAEDEKGTHDLKDDPNFQKGFAAGFITPGPGTWLLLAGGSYYIFKNR